MDANNQVKCPTKYLVCDWQIEDDGIKVDFGDKKVTVCSSECVDKSIE